MDKPFYTIPSGVRELFPPLPAISRKIEQKIVDFFSLYGYEEISTPVFMYELHTRNELFEPFENTFFKLTDKNTGETLILRPDVSLQILQMVLNKKTTGDILQWINLSILFPPVLGSCFLHSRL